MTPNVLELRTFSKVAGDTSAVKLAESADQMIHPTPIPKHPATNLIEPRIANALIFRISLLLSWFKEYPAYRSLNAIPVPYTVPQWTRGGRAVNMTILGGDFQTLQLFCRCCG